MLEIVTYKIDEQGVLNSVKSELAGACVLFVGTTRRLTAGKETMTLEYQAYIEMAINEIYRLRQRACADWPITQCSIVHRIGEVPVGESSVAVAVSSPHRVAAFESASWIMDTLKKDVPIWKKEVWTDGTGEWIHPVDNRQSSRRE